MRSQFQVLVLGAAGVLLSIPSVVHGANTKLAEKRAAQIAEMPDGASQTRYMGSYFNDAVLIAAAKHMPNLEQLNACHGDATDAGLKAVGRLHKLEILFISGDKITDAGVAHLSQLSKLKELRIRSPQMTDAGLVELAKLPNLRKLTLFAAKVTEAGVAQFLSQHPQCEILGSPPAVSVQQAEDKSAPQGKDSATP